MPAPDPQGPFCQSCAMPLAKPEDFGTDHYGHRVNDYCRYCFSDGAFTDPGISMQTMLEKCVAAMVQHGVMPADEARSLMAGTLPHLRRWRHPVGV